MLFSFSLHLFHSYFPYRLPIGCWTDELNKELFQFKFYLQGCSPHYEVRMLNIRLDLRIWVDRFSCSNLTLSALTCPKFCQYL